MRWYYKKAEQLELSKNALALLHCICWYARKKRPKPLSDDDILNYTHYTARQTLSKARKELAQKRLIAYEHERLASDPINGKYGTSNAYVYHVRMEEEQ